MATLFNAASEKLRNLSINDRSPTSVNALIYQQLLVETSKGNGIVQGKKIGEAQANIYSITPNVSNTLTPEDGTCHL